MKKAVLSIVLIAVAAVVVLRESTARRAWPIVNSKQNGHVIVAFGDSLTSGYGAGASGGYPGELAKELGTPVVNLGREGDTAALAQKRLPEVTALKPNFVLLTLGSADLRQQVPLDETLAALDRIFSTLQEQGAMVAYLAISPPAVGDNWLMAIRDLCRRNGVLWVDGVMNALWDNPDLMVDSLHPNDAGYQIMARKVHEALKPYL